MKKPSRCCSFSTNEHALNKATYCIASGEFYLGIIFKLAFWLLFGWRFYRPTHSRGQWHGVISKLPLLISVGKGIICHFCKLFRISNAFQFFLWLVHLLIASQNIDLKLKIKDTWTIIQSQGGKLEQSWFYYSQHNLNHQKRCPSEAFDSKQDPQCKFCCINCSYEGARDSEWHC